MYGKGQIEFRRAQKNLYRNPLFLRLSLLFVDLYLECCRIATWAISYVLASGMCVDLSALLGVKSFIGFIIACGCCNERQLSANRIHVINYSLSLSFLSNVISVNFLLDIDGKLNVYEVSNEDNDKMGRTL
jgi:hypothetical protein